MGVLVRSQRCVARIELQQQPLHPGTVLHGDGAVLEVALDKAAREQFFNDTAPTEIYTLPLPDALPIHALAGADHGPPPVGPTTTDTP